MDKYINPQQQRILTLIELLVGNEFSGVSRSDLLKATKIKDAMLTRDLANLKLKGWLEETSNKTYRLTPTVGKYWLTVMANFDKVQTKLDELKRRYS